MDDEEKISFRCIVTHVRDGTISFDIDSTEKKTLPLQGYRNKIRGKHSIPGKMRFYTAKIAKNNTKPRTKDREITDLSTKLEKIVGNGGLLLVDHDPTIATGGGGFGEGAKVRGTGAGPVRAQGGRAGGGERHANGDTKGGDGMGGDGLGEGVEGRGGEGIGGGANTGVDNPNAEAEAGDGFGGEA